MSKHTVHQLPDGTWAVVRSTHPTKGAADKANNKIAQREDLQNLDSDEESVPSPDQDLPDYLELRWKGSTYTFNFFVKSGIYVAICSVPKDGKIKDFVGLSTDWRSAANECLNKIQQG